MWPPLQRAAKLHLDSGKHNGTGATNVAALSPLRESPLALYGLSIGTTKLRDSIVSIVVGQNKSADSIVAMKVDRHTWRKLAVFVRIP